MELHEKKISELCKSGYFFESDLKAWAIAVVKELKKIDNSDVEEDFIMKGSVANFLIDRFELTEEDLE